MSMKPRPVVRDRRGFTLMELIVGAVIGSVVMTGVMRTVFSTQRNSESITNRIDVQQSVRAASHYLSTVFRELDASDGDIVALSADGIEFRGMRWTGILCADPVKVGSNVLLRLRQSMFYGVERPDVAEDSILIYRDGATSTRADDRWVPGGVQSIVTGICTDGAPASLLTVGVSVAEGGADSVVTGVTDGAPVRGFNITELSVVQAGNGRWWLGRRTSGQSGVWSSIQPLIGPISDTGFEMTFFDADDNVTTTPAEVRSLGLTIRGESMERVSGRLDGHIRDSIATRVMLRNNRRF